MPPVGFEPTSSAGERPQTYALDRVATGTGKWIDYVHSKWKWTAVDRFQSLLAYEKFKEYLLQNVFHLWVQISVTAYFQLQIFTFDICLNVHR